VNPSKGCPFHQFLHIKEFDALDDEARRNPWPFYDWLRSDKKRTVYKVPHEEAFFMLHRYEDVKTVFADTENFSNKIIPVARSPFLALMDGNDHARIRNVVSFLFTPKNLQLWEPQLKKVIAESTERILQEEKIELFNNWAHTIPLGTLSVLFGLNTSEKAIQKLHEDSIAINKALFVTGGTGPRRSENPSLSEKLSISYSLLKNLKKIWKLRKLTGKEFRQFGEMLRVNEKNIPLPRPNFEHIPAATTPMLDLMLAFAAAIRDKNQKNASLELFRLEIEKKNVTLPEMIMAGAFILFAGYETTASLLSNCFVHLARDPKLFQQIKAKPELIDDFIEESLRYYTPVGRFLRRAIRDVEIGGTLLPKNSIVLLMPGAANTDPDKFENGCAFEMTRNNNRQHLSFGKGAHFCVGAPLARMQVTLALTELIKKANSISIDESSPLEMVTDRDNGILRYEKLYVNVKS